MIEEIIKKYLDGHFAAPSFLERPENPPERYIIFEKTGGSETNHIDSATIAFQCYAESLYEVAKLNVKLKTCLNEMIYFTDISKAKLNSDYNFTDPETKEYRYQAVYDFKY